MSKPYPGDWVIRSALFVPGHIDKMLARAADSGADCLLLDLEDAVPSDQKAEARQKIRQALEREMFTRSAVFVRVNSFETELTEQDLEGVVCRHLHGIVFPNANAPGDIEKLDRALGQIEKKVQLPIGHLSITPLVETPRGVLNAYAIAQSSARIVGLIFGCEDFLAELQGRHGADEAPLQVPRAMVAMAARAAGIEPIDTPYIKVYDLAGLQSFARAGRDLGMSGMCALTPDQVRMIKEVYTPAEDDVRMARELMEAAQDAGNLERGVFISDGRFVAPPTLRAAAKTLARHEAIRDLEAFKRAKR
ncbi:MAG TPA: CoA ester lyase [bacterium]|jgi:citrate lyase subunit beta/citryl-CoA lyase